MSAAERKWGGVRGETKAASGSPLGTKPFLKAQQAGWSNGGSRHRQRQTPPGSLIMSEGGNIDRGRIELWPVIIAITGLG